MAGHSYVTFGWSWTEVSVLGSQLYGQASMESCVIFVIRIGNKISHNSLADCF